METQIRSRALLNCITAVINLVVSLEGRPRRENNISRVKSTPYYTHIQNTAYPLNIAQSQSIQQSGITKKAMELIYRNHVSLHKTSAMIDNVIEKQAKNEF